VRRRIFSVQRGTRLFTEDARSPSRSPGPTGREIIGDVPVFRRGRVSRGASTTDREAAIVEDVHAQIPTFYSRGRRFGIRTRSAQDFHLSPEAQASSTRPELSRWDRCSPQISDRRSSKSNASRNCYRTERLEGSPGVVTISENPVGARAGISPSRHAEDCWRSGGSKTHDRMERSSTACSISLPGRGLAGARRLKRFPRRSMQRGPSRATSPVPADLVVADDLSAGNAGCGNLCQLLENIFRNAIVTLART